MDLALQIRIRSASARTWQELAASRPSSLAFEERATESVLWHTAEPVTGIRLRRESEAHVIVVPGFASLNELSLASLLAGEIAKLTGGALEVNEQPLTRAQFAVLFDDQLAPDFLRGCLDELTRAAQLPAGDVSVIDGVRRPYYLGRNTVARILAASAAAGPDDELYTRLTSVVQAIQTLAPPTRLPAHANIRTPDGSVARCAMWDPHFETLLPPCDYLLLRVSETSKLRIPHARIPELVGQAGAPIDELQWLLLAQDEPTRAAIIARGEALGDRLKLRDL